MHFSVPSWHLFIPSTLVLFFFDGTGQYCRLSVHYLTLRHVYIHFPSWSFEAAICFMADWSACSMVEGLISGSAVETNQSFLGHGFRIG